MRLEAAVGAAIFTTNALCSAAFGQELLHALNRRHVELHLLRRQSVPTTTTSTPPTNVNLFTAGVFDAPTGWPTVSVPAGFTLAAGVEVTAIPANTVTGVTGTAALASALATAMPSFDPATWSNEAAQKCAEAVANLGGNADNPSGMVACYNVPYLDDQKGLFEGEVRVFNVSMQTDAFVGVEQGNMMLNVLYDNASLTNGTSFPVRRVVKRQTSAMTTPSTGVLMPTQVMVQKFLAQLDSAVFTPGMNISDLRAALTPTIMISATNPQTSSTVNATLSTTQASFVAGLYAVPQGSLSDPSFLLGKPLEDLTAAAQGLPTPFVVPGLSLGVFPVGLMVTSFWTLAFFITVGYGTVGRMQFRDQFRRAVRQQQDSYVKRL